MVFLKEFFKNLILKKVSRQQKSMQNFPVGSVKRIFKNEAVHDKSTILLWTKQRLISLGISSICSVFTPHFMDQSIIHASSSAKTGHQNLQQTTFSNFYSPYRNNIKLDISCVACSQTIHMKCDTSFLGK